MIATGRSLSWAHLFLTYFRPLEIVIAEGGGAVAYRDAEGRLRSRFLLEEGQRRRLEGLCRQIARLHPKLSLSADSIGRVTDRAVELDDYLNYPNREDFDALLAEHGATGVCSNVHFNFWCGEISKAKAAVDVLERDLRLGINEAVFFGDAPNDESMFRRFPHSVGVANIQRFLDGLEFPPAVVLEGGDNEGALGVLGYLKASL